jgi:hypothetical protein
MEQTAREMWPQLFPGKEAPADRRAVIQAVLDARAKNHPDNDTVIGLAAKDLKETTDFVRAKQLVTVPDEPLEVTPWPEFSRGVAVASCNPPGILEKNGKTFFYISPTPADWKPERVESFFREYNDDMLQDLTIHEAMPGHFLQLAHANKFHAPTLIRNLAFSGPRRGPAPRARGLSSKSVTTPLNSGPWPSGQVMGQVRIPSTSSTSCRLSKGSRPSRSSLLTKVKMGMPRRRQTWKSLRVCASTPLAQSMSITALSAAVSVR